MANFFKYLRIFGGIALGLLAVSGKAEDTDLFTSAASSTNDSNAPALLFSWDNRASFSANASEQCLLGTPSSGTAATGVPIATALSGTSGGIEQCAIFNVIQAMPVTAVAKIQIGIMALWSTGIKDYLGNTCTSPTREGGCLLYPVTGLTTSTKLELLNYIKQWTASGNTRYNIKVNASAGGPATLMQESWAYLYGKTGLSGRDYASVRPTVGCAKYFVAYVGNNFGSSAKIVADSGTNAWAALAGTIGTVGMRANPIATTLERTKIRPTSKDAMTSCSPPPSIAAGQTSDPNGWYADEWTRYMKNQGIQTYTIGLIDNRCDPEYAWILRSMAAYGGGKYFETTNYDAIKTAFETIISEVQSVNSVFAAVSLPISVNTQGAYLNQVFVGMFRPDPDALPRWEGNLKQYKLGFENSVFRLLDADNNAAISASGTNFIGECARSFWTPSLTTPDQYWASYAKENCLGKDPRSNTPDGNLVEKGGQAYMLRSANPANRVVYTCAAGPCTALSNFTSSTTTYGAWQRGTNDGPTSGQGAELPATIGSTGITTADMRPSAHGDIVHSRPFAINFGNDSSPKVVVFYGGNDGMLRAINGNRSEAIGSVAAGAELWTFVPPEFYSKISRRRNNSPKNNTPSMLGSSENKDYGMDGPVTAYIDMNDTTKPAFVYSTMRRGGRAVYAFAIDRTTLAVTAKWKKGCDSAGCMSGFEQMGQSWSTPTIFKATGYRSGTSPLIIMGGGYDATCEDPLTFSCTTFPSGTSAGVKVQPSGVQGNRIYVMDADTGELVKTFKTFRSVVGEVQILRSSDGKATYGYAADLGGDIYRISGSTANTPIGSTAPADWTITRIAMLGCASPAATSAIGAISLAEAFGTNCTSPSNRKFLNNPDIIIEGDIHYLLLGSGNREQPLAKPTPATTNYFFVVKDKPTDVNWLLSTTNGNSCNGNDVLCLGASSVRSANACLTTTQTQNKIYALPMALHEAVVTSGTAAFGTVYFSSYQPSEPSANSCSANLGIVRAYQLNFKTLGAATAACDQNPYSTLSAGGIPPSPVLGKVKLDDGTVVAFCIGCVGPLESSKLPSTAASLPSAKTKTYWYIKK